MGRTTKRVSGRVREILLGTLLGDAAIVQGKGYANPRIVMRHSAKQTSYMVWKAKELSLLTSDNAIAMQGKDGKDGWGGMKLRFQSLSLPVLSEVYMLVAPHKKKEVRRKWLNQLSSLSLSVWWCDDGSLISNTRHGVLCTDGYTEKEVHLIQRYLKIVWGIETSIGATSRPGQFRIHIRSKRMLEKWLRLILPHVPVKEMLYKCALLYRDEALQQRWISEMVSLTSFSEKEIIDIVLARKATLKHFR